MSERHFANGHEMTAPPAAPSVKLLWFGALLIAVAMLLTYAPHLDNGFVYDDHYQIEGSPYLAKDVSWFEPFQHSVWEHMQADTIGEAQPYYRPLLYLAYRLANVLGGGAPSAFHLLSLFVHAICVGLSWLTLVKLGFRRELALVAVGLFALHPLASEQVYYAANITESLLLAGMLIALIGVLSANHAEGGKRGLWLVVATLGVAIALFSKETAIVLPALLTLEVIRHPRPEWGRRLLVVGPLWLLLGGYLAVRSIVLTGAPQTGWASLSLEPFGSAGYALFWAIRQLLVPFPLTPSHSFPQGWWVIPLGLLTLLLFAALGGFLLRRRLEGFLWFAWLVLPLLPPLALFFRNSRAVSSLLADHNLYCSLLPTVALLVMGGQYFLNTRVPLKYRKTLAVALIFVIGFASGVTSNLYGSTFFNDEMFYEYSYDRDPDSITVLNGLAGIHFEKNELEQALSLLQKALVIEPKFARTHYNLGKTLLQMGRPAEAAVHLQRVALMGNAKPDVFDLLAEALRKAGNLRGARYYLEEALSLDPGRTATRVNLGLVHYQLGNVGEAIQHLQQAVADVPDHEEALFTLGVIYRQSGDRGLASYYLRRYLSVAAQTDVERRVQVSRWLAEQ